MTSFAFQNLEKTNGLFSFEFHEYFVTDKTPLKFVRFIKKTDINAKKQSLGMKNFMRII